MYLNFRHEKSFFDTPISKKIYNLNNCYAKQICFALKSPLGAYHQPQVVYHHGLPCISSSPRLVYHHTNVCISSTAGCMESKHRFVWNPHRRYGITVRCMESKHRFVWNPHRRYGITVRCMESKHRFVWNPHRRYEINRRLHKNPSRSVCFWHFLVCFSYKSKAFFFVLFFCSFLPILYVYGIIRCARPFFCLTYYFFYDTISVLIFYLSFIKEYICKRKRQRFCTLYTVLCFPF